MDQKDRVGQYTGESDHRNNTFSDMLSSLIARKRLLVATIRVLPISSPTMRSERENGPEPGATLGQFFLFLHRF